MSPFIKNFRSSTPNLSLEKRNVFNIFKNTLTINICLVFFILIFLSFYLIKINSVVAASFKINDLEKRVEDLKKENQALQLEESQLESLNNTEDKVAGLQMVKANNVEYLKSLSDIALGKR